MKLNASIFPLKQPFPSNWIKTEPLIFQHWGSWAICFYCLLFYMKAFMKLLKSYHHYKSRILLWYCMLWPRFLSYLKESLSEVCLNMGPSTWCGGALWRANVQSTFCKMSVMVSKHFLPLGKMTWVHSFRSYLLENGSWGVQVNKAWLLSIQTDMLEWSYVLWWHVFLVLISLQQILRWGHIATRLQWSGFNFSSVPCLEARVRIFVLYQGQDLCSLVSLFLHF